MPNVRGSQGSHQGGQHTSDQVRESARPALARDDLSNAFAGDENKGPASDPKLEMDGHHSTNVKSRKTEQSKLKTPKR